MGASLGHRFTSAAALEACERELAARLEARGVYYGGNVLPTFAHAFLAPTQRIASWARAAERLVAAAERAAKRLLSDHAFFKAMGLSERGRELVEIDPGYSRILPLCRPDGIPVGDDVRFIEVNSDSPAMMMFIDIVADCLLELPAFEWLREYRRPQSAADRLLDTLLECNREFGGTSQPNIAITDWEGQSTRFEHESLAEHFTARGYPSLVCDPRAFRAVDGELHIDGRRIDVVYRRALAAEIISRQDEVEPLLTAYRRGKVCMVNPLRSYVAGAKSVLSVLAEEEPGILPHTMLLDSDAARAHVSAAANRWVLKKSEGRGGESVILPEPENAAQWQAALAASNESTWIAQEYLDVPRVALTVSQGDALATIERFYNWNPFVFGGRYAAGLVRVSPSPLINISQGGGLLTVFEAG